MMDVEDDKPDLENITRFGGEKFSEVVGLDRVQEACQKFAQALVRLDYCGVANDDPRYKFMQNLLNHAISRKKIMLMHFPPHLTLPPTILQERRSLLTQEQRMQLIVQIHGLKFLMKMVSSAKQGQPTESVPLVVQHALSAFNFAMQIRQGKLTNLTPAQQSQISVALSTASRLAERVNDPVTYLLDVLGEHFSPKPLPRDMILAEREKLVESSIQERVSQLSTLNHRSVKQEVELRSLKLRRLQKRLREKMNEHVPWDEIATGCFLGTKDEIAEAREAKRRKRESLARKADLKLCLNHAADFTKFHKDFSQNLLATAKACADYLRSKDTKALEQERIAQRLRLAALKEQDEEAYFKLVKEAKNDRLHSILRETDSYLAHLAELILSHKAQGEVNQELEDLKSLLAYKSDFDEEDDMMRSRKLYEAITHTLRTTISEQPKLLKGGELKDFQMTGLSWLVSLYQNNLNGILADEMGLGKTVQTIALFAYLMESCNNFGPFLVVAPTSTLHNNWRKEFEVWLPSAIVIVYDGDKDRRKSVRGANLALQKFNVLITSYDFIMRDKRFLSNIEWEYMVVDEAHRVKNEKAKLSLVLNKHYKAKHRVALTGTPLQNNLPELWSLLNFLHPDVFNTSIDFENWFSSPLENAGIISAEQNADLTEEEQLLVINRLHTVLRPFMLRRMKKDVISRLPVKVERIVVCQLSGLQTFMYASIESREVPLQSSQVQYRKVCNHPYLFHDFMAGKSELSFPINDDLIRACGKLEMLDRILTKLKLTGHRILIFFQMTKMIDIVEMFLDYRGHSYLRLDGATKKEDRVDRLEKFNAGSEVFVFLLSTKAGGVGLNLQTADTVILYDSDWNPQNDLQAQARAHRIGQEQNVLVLRLVTANTVEEQVMISANTKLEAEAVIIRAGMFNTNYQSAESRKMLETLLADKRTEEGEEEFEDTTSNDELDAALARSDDELKTFQEMDSSGKSVILGLTKIDELPQWVITWWEKHAKKKFDQKDIKKYTRSNSFSLGHPKENEIPSDQNIPPITIKLSTSRKPSVDDGDLHLQDLSGSRRSSRNVVTTNVVFKYLEEVSVSFKVKGKVIHSEPKALIPRQIEKLVVMRPRDKAVNYKEPRAD